MPNLAELPQAERDEIEADKDRWFQCHKMLNGETKRGVKVSEPWTNQAIRQFISEQPDSEQQDWRDRLNEMKGRMNASK